MDLRDVKLIIENQINKDVKVIKRFSGGMSNYTYLIEVEDELYTYRIPGKNSEVFIDREIESKNLQTIKKLKINCENVFINIENGHKMSKYIEGEDLSLSKVDYNEVASTLKKLHNSNLKAINNYDKLKRLSYYEKLIDNNDEKYNDIKLKVLNEIVKYSDVEQVFCHGDSQKSNFIKSNNLYLLDWEFAGNNDPYYDIACFGNVDFNDAINLLEAYLQEKPSEDDLKRLILNRCFQCLQWYNVALYKDMIGLSKDLNINFKQVSNNYLKKVTELFNNM